MATLKTPKALKPVPEHKDKLGRPLAVGNYVAYPDKNMLKFGMVAKLNPKLVKVQEVPASRWTSYSQKYSGDLVLLDPKDMTWYLLKTSR